jgi:anti-sigma B factor antagonist
MQRVNVQRLDGAVVVSAHGELDAFTAPELTDAFAEASTAGGDRIVIDLSLVSFMDSTALGVVVRTVNEFADRGGDTRLVLPNESARRIFEITTLDRILPLSATRAEALRDLGGGHKAHARGD